MHDVHLVDRREPPAACACDRRSRAGRSARPPAASTRTCRTTCRRRGCPSRRSRAHRRARARSTRSIPSATRRSQVGVDAELLADPEQALLRPDGLPLELRQADGGEQDGVGSRGRPRASRRAAASPWSRIALPPKGCSECSIPSASSTRIASAATSGPIPSPGRTATCVTRSPCAVSYAAIVVLVLQRERDVVETVQEPVPRRPRRRRTATLAAVRRRRSCAARGRRSSPTRVSRSTRSISRFTSSSGSTIATSPFLAAFVRKMSPNDGATTTSKP